MKDLIPQEVIEKKIYLIRGQKVMLDSELALLYGVETKNLNKAIKRNMDRFPEDFMFQLTLKEFEALRFQFGTSKNGTRVDSRGYICYTEISNEETYHLPHCFLLYLFHNTNPSLCRILL